MNEQARRHTPPNRVRYPADCQFASVNACINLSTPLRDDAVTFSFGVMACPGTDLHHAVFTPARAHSFRLEAGEVDLEKIGAFVQSMIAFEPAR